MCIYNRVDIVSRLDEVYQGYMQDIGILYVSGIGSIYGF